MADHNAGAPGITPVTAATPDEPTTWARRATMITGLCGIAALSMVGAEATTGAMNVVVGEADWQADATVAAENMFNDPAPEGSTYVMVPVKVINVAAGDVTPRAAVNVSYVAPDGREFRPARQVVPEDLDEIALLPQGESATGNVVFAIPTEAQHGGAWVVNVDNGGPAVFVAL